MTNNDILIRLRYALDIKNVDMVEIFKLGGMDYTKEEILNMLLKVNDEEDAPEQYIKCNNKMLEAFLNGLITFKRGPQKTKEGQPEGPLPVSGKESPNNMLLKKVKIALALTTEDMLEILYDGGIKVTKGELGAILRNPSHRNYKECGDSFVRNFLRGLTYKYRE
ncbi:DUF1456 family protein [Lysinibacillus sp. fkY74-1]|uniref:Cytoplasmic protein n=2 Tax=Lysinibacillus TaxID=400634 RepID=W7RX94_LYSSH|nr:MULTISPECIES: DUF1456 family protein [Lysinibacillus]MBE5085873.1 DUF1456 family protein [Bacillus thuringiensis]AMO32069.1 cytoplasmic protein [Lysinibacillus sphaericus]AMR88811.1 cytoplasmic protein [Lysinibacillus sphaericus]ANA46882.1 cytoplasmic protein [Lysinibacillus sphaericus]EWH30726.1 hypothetical protein P799_23050 [Lysinibacillus sphaericus CBAM5]